MKILCNFSTYKRYDTTLALTIYAVAMQTRVPNHLIIFDDTPKEQERKFWEEATYVHLMRLVSQKGISWEIRPGWKKGAHHNHETANKMKGYDAVWMIDDDHCPEPNCLEELEKELKDGVGAVGGLIIPPGTPKGPLPPNAGNKIDNLYIPNVQWFNWEGEPMEVEHIYSSFLYRSGIVHHDTRLSSVVFRGETMLTHSLYLLGYKLIITPKALMWHLPAGGGIHAGQDTSNWNHDQDIFNRWLMFKKMKKFLAVLYNGKGDQIVFKKDILPKLREKYGKDLLVAASYPDVFEGEEGLISIQSAEQFVDIKDYSIYEYGDRSDWKDSLSKLYEKFYLNR